MLQNIFRKKDPEQAELESKIKEILKQMNIYAKKRNFSQYRELDLEVRKLIENYRGNKKENLVKKYEVIEDKAKSILGY